MGEKHTPAPWVEEVDKYATNGKTGWIVGVVEYAGCGSHEAEWTSEANKRLALAAPDLLEALQALMEPHDEGRDNNWDGKHKERLSAARVAIAKAAGVPNAQ